MRGARMATRSSLSSIMRKKLSDVTNLPTAKPTSQDEKLPEIYLGDKDRIDQLMRERISLIKLVAERNKIIELSGAELQKLRVSVQKLQLQNWNLARSNSQMLAELNSGREKVKTLQHELLCKEALLKAKNFEMQGKAEMNCQNAGSKGKAEMNCQNAGSKFKEAEEATLHQADNDDKPRIGNKRRATISQSLGASTKCQKVEQSLTLQGKEEMKCQNTGRQLKEGEEAALQEADKDEKPCVGNKMRATRSQSMGTSITCQNIDQKDKVENKRWSLRRQSARFKSHEKEQTENLFEIDEAKFPENPMCEDDTKEEEKEDSRAAKSEGVSQRPSIGRPLRKAVKKDAKFPENPIPNDDPTPLISSTKKEKEDISAPKSEGVSQRSSIGRPLRKAVEKIQSYKEPPLHVKMRRSE